MPQTAPPLTDADLEPLLVIADELASLVFNARELAKVARTLERIRGRYGLAGVLEVGQVMTAAFAAAADRRPPRRGPLEHDLAAYLDPKAREEEARATLRIAAVCPSCDRLRRGRQWVEAEPPAGWLTVPHPCPNCLKRKS